MLRPVEGGPWRRHRPALVLLAAVTIVGLALLGAQPDQLLNLVLFGAGCGVLSATVAGVVVDRWLDARGWWKAALLGFCILVTVWTFSVLQMHAGPALMMVMVGVVELWHHQRRRWGWARMAGPPLSALSSSALSTLPTSELVERWTWLTSPDDDDEAESRRRARDRSCILDELERRDPERFRAWLRTADPLRLQQYF